MGRKDGGGRLPGGPETGDHMTAQIPWPPAKLEGTTPEWCSRSAGALALLLVGREGIRYDEMDTNLT